MIRALLALLPAGSRRTVVTHLTLAVVSVLLFAGPILEHFPMAALGALVVFAAFRIVEFAEFRWLWGFRRSEFWLAMAALVAVLTFDLLVGGTLDMKGNFKAEVTAIHANGNATISGSAETDAKTVSSAGTVTSFDASPSRAASPSTPSRPTCRTAS